MLDQSRYDVRASCFNEITAEKLARNRQINALNKNKIDIITPGKTVLKRLHKELGLKDADAEKTTIARAILKSEILFLLPQQAM